MRCEEFLNQLNARADGELHAADAAELEAHRRECPQCGAAAEALPTIDAELRRAFVPRREAAARLAESTAVKLRASQGASASIASLLAPARHMDWAQLLVGLAAGFLLAVAVFRPGKPKSVAPAASPPRDPIARLVVASGPVEVRPASQAIFFACEPPAQIGRDSIVRTGPTAQCELSLADGNALRLDCNTEVTLHDAEVAEVKRGRLWSSCPAGRKGLKFQSGGDTIETESPAQLALECHPQAVRLIVVDGVANVRTSKDSVKIGPGKQVRIVQGNVEEDPRRRDALLETAWVNSLLALRSSEDPELALRVNQLLANVGATKLSVLYEDELRRLGDAGVPPLLAYLDSTRDTPDVPQRATAARIVADVAQSRWIADLIGLLTDANGDVRFHAARGLERLTGRDQSFQAQAWQSQPWGACEAPHKRWLNWWAANRDRYPAARRDIPAPTSPPF